MINNQPCSPSHSAEPYILIMEYVSCGTLRTFLQTQRAHLISDPELQSLLTIASYHIALAVQHLHSKMVTLRDGIISTKSNKDNKSIFFFFFPADCALWLGSEEHHGQQVSLGGEVGWVRTGPGHDKHGEPPQLPMEKPTGETSRTHTHMVLAKEDIFHFSVLN